MRTGFRPRTMQCNAPRSTTRRRRTCNDLQFFSCRAPPSFLICCLARDVGQKSKAVKARSKQENIMKNQLFGLAAGVAAALAFAGIAVAQEKVVNVYNWSD